MLVTLRVERGFVADDLGVVGEQDLLGERISRPARRRKRADQFIAEATEIAEGDLVVHQDHGIGRYDGLVTLDVGGARHDCLFCRIAPAGTPYSARADGGRYGCRAPSSFQP